MPFKPLHLSFMLIVLALTWSLVAPAGADECVNQVPVMTGPDTPSGLATSSRSEQPAWLAFDDSVDASAWVSEDRLRLDFAWLAYDFGKIVSIDRYTIQIPPSLSSRRVPNDWRLEGLQGSSWRVLDTRREQGATLSREKIVTYSLARSAEYSKYRLWITDDNRNSIGGDGVKAVTISHLTLEACTTDLVDDFEDGDTEGWFLDGIGHANQVSAEVVDDGSDHALALTSDGATAYIQRDNAGFLYRELTGDFRIESDVDTSTMTTGKAWRKAGLMARASLDDLDLRVLAMHVPVQGSLQFVARDEYAGPGNVKLALEVPGIAPQVRLAIERTGQTMTVQYSTDGGTTWVTPSTRLGGSVEILDLPETLLVGVAVVSNDISVTSTAQFDNILIRPAP